MLASVAAFAQMQHSRPGENMPMQQGHGRMGPGMMHGELMQGMHGVMSNHSATQQKAIPANPAGIPRHQREDNRRFGPAWADTVDRIPPLSREPTAAFQRPWSASPQSPQRMRPKINIQQLWT